MPSKKSTSGAGLLLQSIISRAADNNMFVVMTSLDLSAEFDLVNEELLIKRLRIIGLPIDLIRLMRMWLTDRKYFVNVDEVSSSIHYSNTGTILGFVLGPVLYAIFVSLLFDLTNITNFADENFIVMWNGILSNLVNNLEKELEMITKWLRGSGLLVNSEKTEICNFHRNDQSVIQVRMANEIIVSKKSMNVLGVTFDCKLNWSEHISNTIKKSNKALYTIRMIKQYVIPKKSKFYLKHIIFQHFPTILKYGSPRFCTQVPNNNCFLHLRMQ
jgi:hypothetical protein